MNKFNIDLRSKIIEAQQEYLFNRLFLMLKDSMSNEQISAMVTDTIKRYYITLGRPLTIVRTTDSGHLPFIEDYNDTINEMTADMVILYKEIESVGNAIVENFNYAQSERLRITNRIKNVGSLANDLNLLANEATNNSVYVRDSFTDMNYIQSNMIMGTPAQVSTKEGIVTLARKDTINRSAQATIKLVQGDGEKGTAHIIKRTSTPSTTSTTEFTETITYISNDTPNDDPQVILDGRPDTIFEYQTVNIKRDDIVNVSKEFDIEWVKGKQAGDTLRVKIVVKLKEAVDVNWININPYHPANSTGKITVYSIRTSEDGFDYKSLYDDGKFVLNAEINTTPQTYRQDELFDGKNDYAASKFSGQGVWSFATRKAKYIEFILDQSESYQELVGHTYYERITTVKDPTTGIEKETSVRVASYSVPENIVKGPVGKYLISQKEYIRKNIDVFTGWRYAIGIRDLNIMSYQFAEKSELVSTKYEAKKPIKEVMLYVNEKIPESFLTDLTKANDWIQYFISIDDVNWQRITPVHQNPTTKGDVAPKIFAINATNVDLEKSFQLFKGYLTSEHPVTGIRFKAIFQRPKDADSFTPILEDYSLRLVFEDGNT
jgi:hypothetical protein